jgi:hypothetical protein
MKKLVAIVVLLVLFVGAKQSTVRSRQQEAAPIADDIMHVDSLNKSILELERSVQKLNQLVK